MDISQFQRATGKDVVQILLSVSSSLVFDGDEKTFSEIFARRLLGLVRRALTNRLCIAFQIAMVTV